MSPIDDELRTTLQRRSTDVSPLPDPLGGITSRARRLRRRRVAAAMGSAAVVVAAVAVAVPLAMGGGTGTTVRQPAGSAEPTPSSQGALDPAQPWAERGLVGKEVVASSCAQCRPLFTQQFGSTTETFAVGENPDSALFLARDYTTANGAVLQQTQDLPKDLRVLTWALDGDATNPGRLVVIAAPDALVEYAPEGTGYQQISDVGQAPKGIGLVPLEAAAPKDTVRVTEADGTQVVVAAPDWKPADTSTPVNVLGWVHRGSAQKLSDAAVVAKFDAALPGTGGHYRSLVDGTSNGLDFTFGQAWHDGDAAAHTVAYDSSGVLFLGPETPRDPWVMAAVFSRTNAADLLVVLPRPGSGRIGYAPSATAAFTDIASGRSDLNSVGLVDRDPKALDDRVQVHRGDDSVILTEGVAKLTCGTKDCG